MSQPQKGSKANTKHPPQSHGLVYFFYYDGSRSAEVFEPEIGIFKGAFQCDYYSGYRHIGIGELAGIFRLPCIQHIFVPKTDFRKFPHIKVANTPKGYREVVSWLRKQGVKPTEIVVAMEHTGIYSNDFAAWLFGKKIAFTMLHPLAVKTSFCNG